jgi:beta-glucosidase
MESIATTDYPLEELMEERIEHLLAQMTLEEKVSMLAGADHWCTVPVERLGIPAMKVTDGPVGARGNKTRGGPSSACFPAGVALAATWNPDLVRRVGMALAEEVKAKSAHILLAPTVNIHRSPLAGRNFECHSEDPYLTGRMANAYIQGLQSQGVGACIKHFVCNDSEFERTTISSEVNERALREIYLAPFHMAIEEARPWAVMSAYNSVNGTECSEHEYLLLEILKGEWQFDGIVISDWFGTYSPSVAQGGLDLEMPGPARWMGTQVLEAIQAGETDVGVVDDKVRRLLRTLGRVGAFEHPAEPAERAIDKPEHRSLAREAAGEAIVLLKNAEDILPLEVERIRSIAVIGENAGRAQIQGGGSAHVTPHYIVSPLEGIVDKVGGDVQVDYEIGCTIHRRPPLVDSAWLTTEDGSQNGLTVQFFDDLELSGQPVCTTVTQNVELVWFGEAMMGIDLERFSARLSGRFTAPETGKHRFNLMSVGRSRLTVGGKLVIDNWAGGLPAEHREQNVELEMEAGRSYPIQIEYSWAGGAHWRTLFLGCLPPFPADSIEQAAALAARSDIAIVFAGLTDEWESEGHDRADMELRGDQVELIERVAAANPHTIVVLNTGAPVTMDWLDRVPAVVQAWYPGQEAGNAIADVLFGDVNPSGKLPTTFPRHLKDNPAYINYPGENGRVHYGEGIFVGYRYYDKKGVAPLFPFGYGLSYTRFSYNNLVLSATQVAPGEEIRISVDVENQGSRAGKEVVQLYVRDVESSLMRPVKELKAFAKVMLEPGQKKTVTFDLGQAELSFYDPARRCWVAEPGEFEVLVGSSCQDIRLVGCFALTE